MAPACCLVLLSLKWTSVGADYQQWPWNALLDFYLFSFFTYVTFTLLLTCPLLVLWNLTECRFLFAAVIYHFCCPFYYCTLCTEFCIIISHLHVLNRCTFLTRVFKYNSQWYQLVITLLSLGILRADPRHANILLLRHLPAQLRRFPLLRVPCNCLIENMIGTCTTPAHVKFDFHTGNILQTWQ